MRASSRAVVSCPWAGSPCGLQKCVCISPISAAFAFIFSANPSTLPATWTASATAASFPLRSISP